MPKQPNRKAEHTISVFTTAAPKSRQPHVSAVHKSNVVDAATLKENFDGTLAALRAAFEGALNTKVGGLSIGEIDVNLEVGAEGGIGILGTGAFAFGTSSITVRFVRQ